MYHVGVDEVRHFELVGACVAVFHRDEPNVSFWNVLEQRTILCINVQEQARELSEEFIVDNEDDADGTDSTYLLAWWCTGRRTCDQQVASSTLGWVSTWMGDRLWAGKPSRYVTSHL